MSTHPSIQCPFCGMVSYNPNDIEQRYCGNCHKFHLGEGAYLEPDQEPRNTRHHRRIVSTRPIPNTRSGHEAVLDCGHRVQTFGDLAHAGGVVLCLQCRDVESKA